MQSELINAWPGKSSGHPAFWHMLDVGAVANHLVARQSLTGCTQGDQAAVFLVTLHDLGKFSNSFRSMLRGEPYSGPRHWQHSYRLLMHYDDLVASVIGATRGVRKILYAAVAGHHGGPPEHLLDRKYQDQVNQIGMEGYRASKEAIAAAAPLFPLASFEGLSARGAEHLSWVLCGLTVQADWIGSNEEWFGPKLTEISVANYWKEALLRAQDAVSKAGLHHSRPHPEGSIRVLREGQTPRPMQTAAADVPLVEGPLLALIEDATGAGKTEAALILAARMMAAAKGHGFYFALPTMATSNAMLERLESIVPRLFHGHPSLALTHGRAAINDVFRRIRGTETFDPENGVNCSSWLADNRRRVLLADVGVGTIDQALLSVLPTQFNTLRLRALSERILIVDEAHEFGPYMEIQLRRLLQFQSMLGGSAIVMTATLPLGMRNGYAKAFQKGLGIRQPSEVHGDAYPMLTIVGSDVNTTRTDHVPATSRDIKVHRLEDEAAVIPLLKAGSKRGAACVWIRNTVDGAIAAARALRKAGINADLLHARFTAADRLQHEAVLQRRFGRNGSDRAGRVLVATQVVEASLDLDFDLMVSDLAPVASLIQRAGRLWRHMDVRPTANRPVDGLTLHVLAPDPNEVSDTKWLHRVLGSGASIYPLDLQWRTIKALLDSQGIRAPGGVRELIAAVYGPTATEVPEVLERAEIGTIAERMSEEQQAFNSVLDSEEGYDQPQTQRVFDDDRFPTRLGIPQVTLRLAREHAGMLVPWAGTGPLGWQSSEVQVSAARYRELDGVDQERPEILALLNNWPKWLRGSVLIAPVQADSSICDGMCYDSSSGIMFTG